MTAQIKNAEPEAQLSEQGATIGRDAMIIALFTRKSFICQRDTTFEGTGKIGLCDLFLMMRKAGRQTIELNAN